MFLGVGIRLGDVLFWNPLVNRDILFESCAHVFGYGCKIGFTGYLWETFFVEANIQCA